MTLDLSPDAPGPATQPLELRWDLSRILPDETACRDLANRTRTRAEAFNARYRGHVAELDAAGLRAALDESSAIMNMAARAMSYSGLRMSLDDSSKANLDLDAFVNDVMPDVEGATVFFDVEWQALPAARAAQLTSDPALAPYRHHLEKLTAEAPHTLSEPEEKVVSALEPIVGDWQNRWAKTVSAVTVTVDNGNGPEEKTMEEILGNRYSADPKERHSIDALYARLGQDAGLLADCYNAIVGHRLRVGRLRKFSDPKLQPANLENDLPDAVVNSLIDSVVAHYPLGQRWFRAKAKALGQKVLSFYDQYAPMAPGRSVTQAESRQIVLDATNEFSPKAAAILADAYNGRIDNLPKKHRRGGAFCTGVAQDAQPFVFLNFTGNIKDTLTEAHELGHLLHFTLAQEKQTALTSDTGMAMAEIASTFNEMVCFDFLLRREKDPATRQALIAARVEDSAATIFRQVMMANYEKRAYELRQSGKTIDADTLSEIWMDENRAQFGDSMDLPEGYKNGWTYVGHFISTQFYTYSYAFAHLASLALYAKYRDEKSHGRGQAFVNRYLEMLAAGGSESPETLLGRMGIDIGDPHWVDAGFAEFERMVKLAESSVRPQGGAAA